VKLPMLASLRAPGRLGLVLPATLTLALAVSAAFVLSRTGRRGSVLVGVASALLLVPNLRAPITMSRLPFGPTTRAALAEARARARPGESVLEVPTDCFGRIVGTSSALQILHGLPAVGCQAQHLALPWWSGLGLYRRSPAMAALRCHPEAFGYRPEPFPRDLRLGRGDLSRLRSELGVRFLAVNKRQLGAPECASLREKGLSALDGFEILGDDGRWTIIDLASPVGFLEAASLSANSSAP